MGIELRKPAFSDERGSITDIVQGVPMEHATVIVSRKGAVRGNHYHKESWQWTYLLRGRVTYYAQSGSGPVIATPMQPGHLATSPPMEKHAIVAEEDAEFLVLTRGPRGGSGYEEDTYRLEIPITPSRPA